MPLRQVIIKAMAGIPRIGTKIVLINIAPKNEPSKSTEYVAPAVTSTEGCV